MNHNVQYERVQEEKMKIKDADLCIFQSITVFHVHNAAVAAAAWQRSS